MSWTKTPPIKTGWHYWRKDKTCKWITIDLFKNWQNIGGEWWDSPVPEPGTAFTIPQICEFIDDYSRLKTETANGLIDHIKHPKDGIAATTGGG